MASTKDPKTTITEGYAAFGRGDIAAVIANVHPEADWGLDGCGGPLAFLSKGKGKAAAARYFEFIKNNLEVRSWVPVVIAADGDCVVSIIDEEFVVKATGKSLKTRAAHMMRVRDGLIVEYVPVIDSAALTEAFTPRA